ncbi:MAG: F0F1 ATP synthase subunit delta [Arenicella sp.]
MADNASIARPYAKAVFDLATEAGNQDDWANGLEVLSAVVIDDEFGKIIDSPQIKQDQLVQLALDVCGDKLPQGGDNLIKLLVHNNRLDIVPGVQEQFALMLAESRQSINAEVLTARPLNAEQTSKLSDALEKRLGVTVSITETVDESLIGGAIVKAGDLVIDGSAKGRVEKLASALNR